MAFGSSLTGLMTALVATSIIFPTTSIFLPRSVSTIHIVGGHFGWVIPKSVPSLYRDWASSNTFKVGDILDFRFSPGQKQVIRVSKAAYKACKYADKISDALDATQAIFNLNVTGTYYFISGIPINCEAGQKLSITVGSSAPAPSTAAAPDLSTVSAGENSAAPDLSTVSAGENSAAVSLPAGFSIAAGFSLVVVVAATSLFIF